jgi:hypothetical protein
VAWTDKRQDCCVGKVRQRPAASSGRITSTCPTCGLGEVRAFFAVDAGNSRGAAWLWCSICKTGYHSQSVVPRWWHWAGEIANVLNAEQPFDVLDRLWTDISRVNPISDRA